MAASMNYRDRELLDLCYKIDCTAQIPGACEGGPGEPMHSNQYRHGKGKSIKAHDCFIASGCRKCHVEFDQGKRLCREEKFAIWQDAHDRTMLKFWQLGLVRVA